MKEIGTQHKAELWLIFATMIWGATFTVIKIGLGDASPFVFLGLRFALSFIAMFLVSPKMFTRLDKKLLWRGVLLGLLMFGGYGFQNLGLKFTTVAKSSLITYAFVLFIPPLQYFLTKKNMSKGNIIGLFIVGIGMFILNNPKDSTFNIGDLLTFISAVIYAFYIIGLDRMTDKEPVLLTAIQFFVTAVLGFACAFVFETPYVNYTFDLGLSLFFLAVPGGVIAIFILNRFQKETTPVRASLLYSLEPVFAVIVGFIVLGATLSFFESVGAVIILSGVLLSELWGRRVFGKRSPEQVENNPVEQ